MKPLHAYCRCPECRELDAQHPRDGRQLTFLASKLARPKRRAPSQEKCA